MAPTTRNLYKENPKPNTKTKKRQATTGKKKSKKVTGVMPVISAPVRGEEVPSAIDADTALLEDVLKGNGEEGLYGKIMELAEGAEDDPPVIFGWQNVEVFVQAIQVAQAQAAAPGALPLPACPLALPAVVNVQNFKEALLEYARVPGTPPRLDTTCLPCTQAQVGGVGAMLARLDLNSWIQHIIAVGVPNLLPIARVYVPRPRSNTLDRVMPQFLNSLWE